MGGTITGTQRTARAGMVLVVLGVGVWAVYAAVWLAGGSPQAVRFLPFHLAGVIPGAILSRWPGGTRRREPR